MILALAGGVGGAKLAHGLAAVLPPAELTIVVNTGDDFEHFGLHVAPDLDTMMYTLAGLANPQTGWGLAGETWEFMSAIERLGGPSWFRLGDHDLATHAERTRRLAAGEALSDVTGDFCRRLGVACRVSPMSDAQVRTFVRTDIGVLAFQHYFVRERCEPRLRALEYRGAMEAMPAPAFREALASPELQAVIVCPSNPYLSIGPMLELAGVRNALTTRTPIIAVSPIVGGQALKGPTAKIMAELDVEPSALGIAEYYQDLVDILVIDPADAALAPRVKALGMSAVVAPIVMLTEADRRHLALECVDIASREAA